MSIFPATHSRKQKDFSVTTLAKPTSVACEVRFLFEFCVVIKTGVVGEFRPIAVIAHGASFCDAASPKRTSAETVEQASPITS